MAVVTIRVGGRDYQVACDDGQEEQLRFLADDVDDRVRLLIHRMGGSPGEFMALLLTTLTMSDELIENKKEIEKCLGEIRKLRSYTDQQAKQDPDNRIAQMEVAMAVTLEEIAARIEKIADGVEG